MICKIMTCAFLEYYNRKDLVKPLRIMRLTAFLLLIGCLQLSARGLTQTVTLNVKDAPLEKVFAEIEKQTVFSFVYATNLFEKANKVTLHLKNTAIEEAMDKALANQPFSYKIISRVVIINTKDALQTSTVPSIETSTPPPIDVRGRVVNEKGEPVAASIVVKGTNKGTSTNDNGEFELKGLDGDATLVISGVSIETFEVKVNGRTDLALNAKVKTVVGEEVTVEVNTGYQKIPKERVTGSFVTINNELLNRSVSPTILNKLEGITSGLLFNRNVSAANNPNGVDISIRGISTLLSNNQPLIVVDNFPYDGNIANINPNDIEDITVLKDAAAASIWGAFSGNGVIVITTKKGRLNQKASVELNANVTIGKKPDLFYDPNTISSNDFIDLEIGLFKRGYYNNDLISAGRPSVSPVVMLLDKVKRSLIDSATAYGQINSFRGLDVRNDFEKYLLRQSVAQQYSVGIRGGSASSDYFFSMGYDNNLGNYVGNNNNRVTVNALSNFYLFKNFQLTAGINFIQANTAMNNNLSNIKVGGTRGGLYPYAQLADQNGNPLILAKDYNSGYKDTVGNGKLTNWNFMPLRDMSLSDFENKLFDNRINLGLKYSFFKNLDVEIKYQYERSNSELTNYYSDSSYYARNLYNKFTNLVTGAHPVPLGGILYSYNSILTSHHGRGQVNYVLNKNPKHKLAAIAGAEISQGITEGNSNTVYGYSRDTKSSQVVDFLTFYTTNPSGSQKIPNDYGFSRMTDRYLSYFGNGAYTYNGKYTLSASGRIDKSNLFGVNTNQKSIPLYSIGTKWDIGKEGFYHLEWLPYSSLRVTYGYNGNVNKRLTAVTTVREASNSTYSGLPFNVIANPGNPDLRWEKVRMVNFGYDFALRNSILSGSFEYYLKKGIDLIGDSPLPPSVGLSTFTGNTANTKGHGFDFTLNTNNITREQFKWQTVFLVSYVKDIVTKYNVNSTASNYIRYGANNGGVGTTIYPLQGKPLFAIYSYKWAGLDHNTGDPLGYVGKTPSSDYNTIIANTTLDSMLFQGTSRPTTFGSLRNSFKYKSFTLSLNIICKFNYYFRRNSIDYDGLFASWSGNKDYEERWQKPGDEAHTNVPSLQYPPLNSNRGLFYSYSSVLVEKGDHIRLQDISLSYDFDKLFKKGINQLQVYSYINNVGILWRANKQHLDPDVYSTGLPAPTTFSFGVKANF
jgi:TonB-linked SusC/RagA family outer membrane protein